MAVETRTVVNNAVKRIFFKEVTSRKFTVYHISIS